MSQGKPNASFLRHALIFGASNMLVYAGSFILLPLFTRYLQPEEYGTLEVLSRIGEVVSLCLLFNAVRQAAITFYGQSQDAAEQQHVLGTVLVLVSAVALVAGGLLVSMAGTLSSCCDIGNPGLLQLALAAALLEGTLVVLLGVLQSRLESRSIALVNLSQLPLRVLLSVLMVAVLGWGIAGVLAASALTSGLYVVGLIVRECALHPLRFDREKLRAIVRFTLPFLPGGLCLFVLNSGDRFLVRRWAGEEAVGIYALGYKLAAAVTTFSVTPLLMVWGTRMYEAARQPDAPEVFGKVVTRILAAHLALGLGVCLFADEIVHLLGGARYGGAAAVIPPVVLACWFLAASCLLDAGFYVRRRPLLKTLVAMAATGVVLVLYVLLIPRFGGMGAAWATVGGFLFQAGLTRYVAQQIFPVRYEDRRLAAMLFLAVALWFVSRGLPVIGWALPVKAGLWVLWPIVLWTMGWITPQEKDWVRVTIGSWFPVNSSVRV